VWTRLTGKQQVSRRNWYDFYCNLRCENTCILASQDCAAHGACENSNISCEKGLDSSVTCEKVWRLRAQISTVTCDFSTVTCEKSVCSGWDRLLAQLGDWQELATIKWKEEGSNLVGVNLPAEAAAQEAGVVDTHP
jgi:hypothetical protein